MLKVRLFKSPPALILGLTGQFGSLSIKGIDTLIVGSQEWGCKHIVFDFSGITWIDPVAVGQLFMWDYKMQMAGTLDFPKLSFTTNWTS